MNLLRGIATLLVLVALVGWSALVLLAQTFKGASVGGPACFTDPSCGEIGWIPVAVWLGGCVVILAIGYWARRRGKAD
jgi:hypothetical protein